MVPGSKNIHTVLVLVNHRLTYLLFNVPNIRVTAFNAPGDPNAGPDAAYDMCAKPAGKNRYDVNQDRQLPDDADLDVWGTVVEANYTMGEAGTWTYVGGYRDTEETSALDVDAGPLSLNWNDENTTHWQTSHASY